MQNLLATLFLLITHSVIAQIFTKTQVVDGIPWSIAFDVADDGRFFTTKKGAWAPQAVCAEIRVNDQSGNDLGQFYNLSDSVHASGEYGLLGITLDPNFNQNHFVYCFYTYSDDPANGGDIHFRVQRFTELNNAGTQPIILLDLDVEDTMTRIHVGGNIHFRPSDSTHLYVSVGDMGTGQLGYNYAATIDNPLGKILRISKYPGSPPPSDNPFYDDGNPYTGNCDWVWAYGIRNSFDFCFGPNDSLYATENGTSTFDEINLITKGGFYGWPYCEGSVDGDTLSIPCHAVNAIPPLVEFPFPLPALTGIIFYTDTVWSAQQNHLIAGDFNHADLSDVFLSNSPAYNVVDSSVYWIDESNMNGITDLWQGPDGCIYVLELGDTIFGGIYKVCPFGTGIREPSPNNPFIVVPNPFTTTTQIHYTLSQSEQLKIELYDVRGRFIATLVDEFQTSGPHTVELDVASYALTPGIYSCLLRGEHVNSAVKLIVN